MPWIVTIYLFPVVAGWGQNDRGVSFTFGGEIVRSFLEKHNCSLIVRAHQVVEDGYQFFQKRQVSETLSSSSSFGACDFVFLYTAKVRSLRQCARLRTSAFVIVSLLRTKYLIGFNLYFLSTRKQGQK